jgi:hypothetical protein
MSSGPRHLGILPEGAPAPSLAELLSAARKRSMTQAGTWAAILFILVNASLFVRPAEIIPALEDWPIYAVLVTGALLVALPQVLAELSLASMSFKPITACIIGMLATVVLSHLSKGHYWEARVSGVEFLKLALYYLLLLATVNNLAKLRQFLAVLVALGMVVTTLAVLQYHGLIDIPALSAIREGSTDPLTGERTIMFRLVGTGIFHDPNDLCLLLVLTMAASAYGMEERSWGSWRMLWLLPLGLFGYAFTLTQSRGGFLALLSAIMAFIWARFGWRRGLPVALIALLGLFLVFAGRQTELSVEEGTGQGRVQIWSQGLSLFRHSPVWGVGQGRFVEEVGHAAHNSFLHAFAELGFFGGAIFLGVFALAFTSLNRLGQPAPKALDPELARLRPYVVAMIAGYAAGLMSLSRLYVVPTYLVLALAAAYIEIARRGGNRVTLEGTRTVLVMRMGSLAVIFLGGMYLFVRLFVHWE